MPSVMDELVTILGVDVAGGTFPKIQKFNSMLDGVTRFAGWAGAALSATAVSIGFFTEKAAKGASQLDKFKQITGITGESIQSLRFAVGQAGGDADSFTSDMMSLTQSMSSPIPGEFNHTLFMLGINLRKANGEMKTADEVLMDVADKFEGMSDLAQVQWASRLGFGQDTLLLLKEGRGEIERLQQVAKDFPLILTDEQTKNARQYIAQLQMLRDVVTYIGQAAASAAGPALKEIVGDLVEFVRVNREFIQTGIKNFIDGVVDGFRRFGTMLRQIREYVTALLPGVSKFVEAMSGADIISAIVLATLTALTIVLGITAAKFILIGAVVTAAALIFEDFIVYLRGGESAIGNMIEWVGGLYDAFKTKFPAIAEVLETFAAVLKGSVVVAFDMVKNAVALVWEGLKMIGGGIGWVFSKIEGMLSKLGFGGGAGLKESAEAVMKDLREAAGDFGEGLVMDARGFNEQITAAHNTPVIPVSPAAASQAQAGTAQQNVEVKQEFHITGANAPAIASETARKTNQTMKQIFPGGLAPVVN